MVALVQNRVKCSECGWQTIKTGSCISDPLQSIGSDGSCPACGSEDISIRFAIPGESLDPRNIFGKVEEYKKKISSWF